jgi:NADPH-dependent curcumin reductase CurA
VCEPDDEVRVDGLVLENEHLRAELAADGTLLSLVHRPTGRETLAAPGNRLELYDDEPVEFDAWDIDPAHLRTRRDFPPAESWSVVTDTPLRCELAFERPGLRQVVRLDAEARRLEFHTEVDWRESRTLLKVCFPLAVRAPNATYETAFGYAERPTHYSSSWDRARYEVPGHRWADLSEHGFGAAVLTDSKYGYSCLGNELRISLLRSPKSPDPEADMGTQSFAYAVMPHAGGWREGGVVRADRVRKLDPEAAPPATALGVLGMPGLTAWVGLVDIGRVEAGETIYVSGAAGAVGSAAAQIAKLKGLRVIGSAGSAEKVEWLRSLGIEAFDYRETDPKEALADGLDVYFYNVGGTQLEAALTALRPFGRVIACGAISRYNDERPEPGPRNLFLMVTKRLRLQGFIVSDHDDRYPAFVAEVAPWVRDGSIRYRETVVDGIENVPGAFAGLFRGDNVGKMLVRVGPDQPDQLG